MSRTRHNILRYKKLIIKPTRINAIPENIFVFRMAGGDDKKFRILSTAIANIRFPSMGTIAERQQIVTISTEFSLSKLKKFGKSVI